MDTEKELTLEQYYAVRAIITEGRKLQIEMQDLEKLAYKIIGNPELYDSSLDMIDAFNSTQDPDILIDKMGYIIPKKEEPMTHDD